MNVRFIYKTNCIFLLAMILACDSEATETTGGMDSGSDCIPEYGAGLCVNTVVDFTEDCPPLDAAATDADQCAHKRCIMRNVYGRTHHEVVDECFSIICPGAEGEKWLQAQACRWSVTDAENRELLDCYEQTPCDQWAAQCPELGSTAAIIARAHRLRDCVGT